jgi:hypothetical protein
MMLTYLVKYSCCFVKTLRSPQRIIEKHLLISKKVKKRSD